MIVVDVGCARYGPDFSIERLIEEFKPDVLYGFDPIEQAYSEHPFWRDHDGTNVEIIRKAAWTFDGEIGYLNPGLRGWISDRHGAPRVPCVDLARFVAELPDGRTVLKIDAEGAEYELLEHLIAHGVDRRLELAWVEWHAPDRGRESIEQRLACEVREWEW